jgi:hypothetical protein
MTVLFRWCVATLIVLGANAFAQAAKPYTMKDLQALVSKSAWRELADHLADIPPAKRDKTWDQIVEKTALGLMDASLKEQNVYEGYGYAEALIDRFPNLKKSVPVMTKRGDIGLKAHSWCFQNSYDADFCNKSLTTFVLKDAKNLDLIFRAGKLVRLNANHAAATPYFKLSLVTPSAFRKCADEDVVLAVVSGLALPTDYPFFKDATAIVNGACFNDLKAPLLTELKKNEGGYFKDNACAIFQAKNALDDEAKAICEQK